MNPFKWLVCWWRGRHVPVNVKHPYANGWIKVCCRCGVECR